MPNLNTVPCLPAGGNTGIGPCSLDIKFLSGGFLAPSTLVIPASALVSDTALNTWITNAILAPKNARLYPLPGFVTVTDNSEDNQNQTFGNGSSVVAREGFYNWSFQYLNGGLCVSNALRKFNSGNWSIFFFDQTGLLFGTKSGTGMKGIPLSMFWSQKWKVNDGSNTAAYQFMTSFDPKYINDLIGFTKPDNLDLSQYFGLTNVVLAPGTRAAGVLKVTAKYGCSLDNLYDLYSAELAATGQWVVTNTTTGALVTITSVAVDANIKGWTITVDTADPDYTATIGGLAISLAPAATLAANAVVGYESNTINE